MKPLFIISSAFDTYSGYGARSRDLIKAIIETDKYEVKLLSQRWGNTPFGFCEDNTEWSFLNKLVLINNQLPKQPEIWMQITVPNEFQPSLGRTGMPVAMKVSLAFKETTYLTKDDFRFKEGNSQAKN